jgi:hypothetical protein
MDAVFKAGSTVNVSAMLRMQLIDEQQFIPGIIEPLLQQPIAALTLS